jgi:hypothetical protein
MRPVDHDLRALGQRLHDRLGTQIGFSGDQV